MPMITPAIALLISAGAGLAATGVTTGLELSQGSPTAPSASTTAQQQAEASNAAAQAQAEALTRRRGMASTQLTSPLGATGSATVGKATLG
jgi:hypothetical protein